MEIRSKEDLFTTHPLSSLGMEANMLTKEYLKEKMQSRHRDLKAFLLDQTMIAGIGNIYADEICFLANLNPEQDIFYLEDTDYEAIADAAKVALATAGEVCDMKAFNCPKCGKTFEERLTDLIAKIGENMNLRRAAMLEVNNGVVASYLHNCCGDNLGKIGVLVALESTADKAKLEELPDKISITRLRVIDFQVSPG